LTSTTITPIPNGAMARLTRDITSHRDREYRKGQQFIVNDYVPAEEAEDGRAFYWGNINDGMNNITVSAEDVEQVMTAEQVNGRRAPSVQAILNSLMSCNGGDGFDVHTAQGNADDRTVTFEGRTDDGLPFGFTIKLIDLGEIS